MTTKTLTSISVNLVEARKHFTKWFAREKADGIKKAWYFYHQACDQVQVLDTRDLLNEMIEMYIAQGYTHTKTLPGLTLGTKSINLLVFRHQDETKNFYGVDAETGKTSFDTLSTALGYYPADCEVVIAEVTHVLPTKPQPKKKKKR